MDKDQYLTAWAERVELILEKYDRHNPRRPKVEMGVIELEDGSTMPLDY